MSLFGIMPEYGNIYIRRETYFGILHYSRVHRAPNRDTHGHFCLIFGNIAILTNLNTLFENHCWTG